MNIRPIRTAADHAAALEEIERLWNTATAGTEAGDKFEVLATLVDIYEREHFEIPAPDPVEAIRFRMEQEGFTNKDLIPIFKTRARVSEVMSKRRRLNLAMIRKLRMSRSGVQAEDGRGPGAAAWNLRWAVLVSQGGSDDITPESFAVTAPAGLEASLERCRQVAALSARSLVAWHGCTPTFRTELDERRWGGARRRSRSGRGRPRFRAGRAPRPSAKQAIFASCP